MKRHFSHYRLSQMSLLLNKGILQGPFNWLNGQLVAPFDSSSFFDNMEPRTGNKLCSIPISNSKDVNEAVKISQEAFTSWSQMSGRDRGKILSTASRKIQELREEIARLDVLDNGKPIWEARTDVDSVVETLEFFGALVSSGVPRGQMIQMDNGSFATVSREPYGVVGAIGAWNYPLQTLVWKAGPALAAGNSFIYKPSPLAPLSSLIFGQILSESGLPSGVFNVLQGNDVTGQLLCTHEGISKISFTGSLSTGLKVYSSAGSVNGLRPVTLELGGKSPLIIFEDADLQNAVKGALLANFLSQGQVCSNGTRIYVERSIIQTFLSEFTKQVQGLKIGDPFDENTTIGATINEEQGNKVLNYIQEAESEGGEILVGGARITLPGDLAKGFYLSPCIMSNLRDDQRILREEVFGAVALVLPFDSESEVIRRANDSIFGLAAGVFTSSLSKAHRVAQALQAGQVWINTYNESPVSIPFGGFKSSGIGRECGREALDFYTQSKSIFVNINDVDAGALYKEL